MKILFVFLVVVVAGCADRSADFERVGYFKDTAKNRVMTIRYDSSASSGDVSRYADGLMYTADQVTAAYFYPAGVGIPADGVTLAGSFMKANDVIYSIGGWRYAYVRGFNGVAQFVDCGQQSHDLCGY